MDNELFFILDSINNILSTEQCEEISDVTVQSDKFLQPLSLSENFIKCESSSIQNENQDKPRVYKKYNRTTFSYFQLNVLKTEYVSHKYISKSRKIELSKYLGLSEKNIQIWFANMRAKQKRNVNG